MTAYASTLGVPELLLARERGLRPLGQVLGTCAYQIGYAARPYAGGRPWPEYPHAGYVELGGPTRAWNTAWSTALAQARDEARALGADAVVGVRIRTALRDGPLGRVEVVVAGTAVRSDASARDQVLTGLSGTELGTLAAAGYRPVGILAATSVTQVLPGARTSYERSGPRRRLNRELVDLSRTPVAARRNVFARLDAQRRHLDADGLVGVTYDQHVARDEEDSLRLVVTLHISGTAVAQESRAARPPIHVTVPLDQERQ